MNQDLLTLPSSPTNTISLAVLRPSPQNLIEKFRQLLQATDQTLISSRVFDFLPSLDQFDYEQGKRKLILFWCPFLIWKVGPNDKVQNYKIKQILLKTFLKLRSFDFKINIAVFYPSLQILSPKDEPIIPINPTSPSKNFIAGKEEFQVSAIQYLLYNYLYIIKGKKQIACDLLRSDFIHSSCFFQFEYFYQSKHFNSSICFLPLIYGIMGIFMALYSDILYHLDPKIANFITT